VSCKQFLIKFTETGGLLKDAECAQNFICIHVPPLLNLFYWDCKRLKTDIGILREQ